MERKLELKDIAGYLPYGLKRMYLEEMFFGTITKYDNVSFNGNKTIYRNYKPILRPLSYLYRTITHNGADVTPILELAKIIDSEQDWELNDDRGICEHFVFWYDKNIIGFCLCFEPNSTCEIPNQYKLFDYLHELKIDYRQLIDNNLAVSVCDFPENPYN